MLHIIFQGGIPVVLGPIGTALAILYGIATTAVSIYLYWRSNEAAHLRSALQTSEGEGAIYKRQAERLREENKGLQTALQEKEHAIGELQARTNLSAVISVTTDILETSRAAISDIEAAHREILERLKGESGEKALARIEVAIHELGTRLGHIDRRMGAQHEALVKLAEREG